ncbi:MAG: hypothetical protein AB2L20_08640 [Mangrovibacterium sp.]
MNRNIVISFALVILIAGIAFGHSVPEGEQNKPSAGNNAYRHDAANRLAGPDDHGFSGF